MTLKTATIETRSTKNMWMLRSAGAAAIILLAAIAYFPAIRGQFIWDDDSWTTNISDLLKSWSGLRAIWFKPTALQQYYPLAGTSFWIDYHLWGFWPAPYHVENIILHTISALMFWGLLRQLRVPGAWLAGAIFAVHPIMVESVAWITERKNVLSMVFYLSALLAYGRFTGFWREEDNSTSPRRWGAYALAFFLFICALLTKTTAFSFPAVILLISWWKRGRIRLSADINPIGPFFVVSIGFCAVTSYLEKHHVGAKGPEWDISFPQRCLIAGHVFWFYIGKLLWPAQLCFVYPRWKLDIHSWRQWIYPIAAVGTLLTLWLARQRIGRGPIAAALFYVGTLFPALGFMNAYYMRYSFVCDHWSYLSSLSLIALAAALVARWSTQLRAPALLYGFMAIVPAGLAILTWRQCGIYSDLETLWNDTLAKDPDAWLADNNLGMILRDRGQIADAIALYEHGIAINPNFPEVHNNLGVALRHIHQTQAAIEQFEIALRLRPDYTNARNNLGNAFRALGRFPQAIAQYDEALRQDPQSAEAHFDLGLVYTHEEDLPSAIENYQDAVGVDPNYFEAQSNLGVLFLRTGKFADAADHFRQAVRIQPDSPDAHNSLAVALWQLNDARGAIAEWNIALEITPDYPEAADGMANALATADPSEGGDPQRAVILAQRACELTNNQRPDYLNTLAIAYAAGGRLDDAIAADEKAVQVALASGQTDLAADIVTRLQAYRAAQAQHSPATIPSQSDGAGSPQHP
jgi:protein O-mannosyl-transferase